MAGSGDITVGDLQLTVGMVAALAGSGHISCSLDLLIFMLAEIGGSGDLLPETTLETMADLSAALHGDGEITSAQIKTLSLFVADILGHGSLDATMFGTCSMAADITSAGELVTAQSCAQAVWSAMASAFNDPGTTGNKLNSASAAGDPWTAELPGDYPPGSAGAILAGMTKEEIVEAVWRYFR